MEASLVMFLEFSLLMVFLGTSWVKAAQIQLIPTFFLGKEFFWPNSFYTPKELPHIGLNKKKSTNYLEKQKIAAVLKLAVFTESDRSATNYKWKNRRTLHKKGWRFAIDALILLRHVLNEA